MGIKDSRLAVHTATATLTNVMNQQHVDAKRLSIRAWRRTLNSYQTASMPEYTTQCRDTGVKGGCKTQEKTQFSMQVEANLTARRFKVTASSKMHLDLSTASIDAALLGTA